MSDLATEFDALVARIRNTDPGQAPAGITVEVKAALYALYKQATEGDVRGARPGLLDVVNRFKFDAHAKLRGMSREAAMRDYIALVRSAETGAS